MLYPMAGQPVLSRYVLPRFDAPADLAAAKGMVDGSLAHLPAPNGGIYRYNQELQGRLLYQDDFSTFDGWTLNETSGTWAKTGGLPTSEQLSPASIIYGPTTGFSGPVATKDLGQDFSDGIFAVDLSWLNNNATAISRLGIALYDATMQPIGAVAVFDGLAAATETRLIWYGSGFNLGTLAGPISSALISNVNPNSGAGWVGIHKTGGTLQSFGVGASGASYASGSSNPVRFVQIFAQGYQIPPTNYPAFATALIRSFMALKSPTNGATLSLAIANGGSGYEAYTPNAFDGNTATNFVSLLNGSSNYGGLTFLGQQLTTAPRYQRLAVVAVINSTNSTPYHPSSGRILMADAPAGPWDVVATYDGLVTSAGATNYLILPPGLDGRRCWRYEPTAGLGANSWTPSEVMAYYGPAQSNPAAQVRSYYANGTWDVDTASGGLGAVLPAVLGW